MEKLFLYKWKLPLLVGTSPHLVSWWPATAGTLAISGTFGTGLVHTVENQPGTSGGGGGTTASDGWRYLHVIASNCSHSMRIVDPCYGCSE